MGKGDIKKDIAKILNDKKNFKCSCCFFNFSICITSY